MTQRPRIRSATSLRGDPGLHGNTGPGVHGNKAPGPSGMTSQFELQETIKDLRRELLNVRAESTKISQQLACLTSLIRRAWTGDKSAVLHVANIVGVAPPELVQDDVNEAENHFVIKAQPKSRVLTNWARLTVGLLNREYCVIERHLEEEALRHLHNRNAFLDGQMESNYVRPTADGDRWEIVQRPATKQAQPKTKTTPQQATSAKKRPTVVHLYRPANQKSEPESRITWGDMVPDHRENSYDRDCLLNKLANGSAGHGSGDQYGRPVLDYADPRRYSATQIYDEQSALGPEPTHPRRQRPASGVDQRKGDLARARPRSAVLPKGERPMKYETTRPVKPRATSATVHGPRATSATVPGPRAAPIGPQRRGTGGRGRPQSGGRGGGSTFITSQHGDDLHMHINLQDLEDDNEDDNEDDENNNNKSDDDGGWTTEDEEREKRRQAVDEILAKIRKPDSVISFENDVRHMGDLEADFKQRTLDLQRKLGIPSSGMVEP